MNGEHWREICGNVDSSGSFKIMIDPQSAALSVSSEFSSPSFCTVRTIVESLLRAVKRLHFIGPIMWVRRWRQKVEIETIVISGGNAQVNRTSKSD